MKSEDQNTIRINKYLSSAGVCSRRDADRLTEAGRVTVNGKKIGTGERIPVDAVICLDGRMECRYLGLLRAHASCERLAGTALPLF